MQVIDKSEVLEDALDNCDGIARVRLGGEIVGFDEDKDLIFINSYDKPNRCMPRARFVELMNEKDVTALAGMPHWDGNNAYNLSHTLLNVVRTVMDRA